MTAKAVAVSVLLLVAQLCAGDGPADQVPNTRPGGASGWEPSFQAGAIDESTGQMVRDTEIVHLAAHKGRLYAGNGYWMDTRGEDAIPWAQVLVLDSWDGT